MRRAIAELDAATVIRALRQHTDLGQVPIARLAGISQAKVSDIEKGGVLASVKRNQQALQGMGAPEHDTAFTHTPTPAPGAPPSVAEPGTDITKLLIDNTDDYALATLELQLTSLASAYVSSPSQPLIPRVRALRDTALGHYQAGARPRHARELLVIVGTCELLLAYAAHDNGNSARALTHLEHAHRCADYTEHPHLHSWTAGTRTLIADWQPTPQALELADRVERLDHGPQSFARITAIKARAAARRGDHTTARTALDQLQTHPHEASEDPEDLSTKVGGIFTFPTPKRDYYTASTLVLLGEAQPALAHSRAAIDAYESGPQAQRSYGDLTLARTDLISAHLLLGDAEAALAAINDLARTPAPARIQQLRSALASCTQRLTHAPLTAAESRQIQDALAQLRIP
ncbi:helix-turn-helix domain-containing protein [Nocardiopsis metallicus]|uniref:Transcriptional regulator with XRE-family HTH domain n=1 Tax=Nocardiopsis metallicus TaxID=179819 RepID=A0A840WP46_9ACTN|nr:helix-turn-helix transcriptional regulator [Nocardiopsis metallicus]MBB5494781.1 transcriptional regulator with XRE-family HTH domain [Nocardiopsis metallicus]